MYANVQSSVIQKSQELETTQASFPYLTRYRAAVWEGGDVLEMDGGDSCTTMSVYLTTLKCTLKKRSSGQVCYVDFTTIKTLIQCRQKE